jgi:RsiW-degrading membrane proteinase PrsW (M82 family)
MTPEDHQWVRPRPSRLPRAPVTLGCNGEFASLDARIVTLKCASKHRTTPAKELKGMNRTVLYVIVVALAATTAVLGYQYYQDQQKSGIELSVGKGGISVETK